MSTPQSEPYRAPGRLGTAAAAKSRQRFQDPLNKQHALELNLIAPREIMWRTNYAP